MSWSLDARIPVAVVGDLAALQAAVTLDCAVVAPAGTMVPAAAATTALTVAGPTHPQGCTCCAARPPASLAFEALFRARLQRGAPWFSRVVAYAPDAATRAAIAVGLTADAVTAARFRPEGT